MSSSQFSFHQLGWRLTHAEQLTAEDFDNHIPARVACVQRSVLTVLTERGEISVAAPVEESIAVGDWILLDATTQQLVRLLQRETLLARMAAGFERRTQVIAANVDTAFVVMSCQEDFNLSRLERYLALVRQARIEPVVVLTKADLAAEPETLIERVAHIAPGVRILALDARNPADAASLMIWLQPGMTTVFIGSSGVGKSTLTNTLTGSQLRTNGIRAGDGKGRHTTTARHMLAVPNGGWIIDTPGMRELKLGAADEGVRTAFDDVEQLAARCRFRDCKHQGDAGCAVIAATADGTLESRRLENYLKLQREAKHAAQSIHERRQAERRFGKMQKTVMEKRRWERGE
jgi:ribosome biogenesis GTPase